MIKGKIEQAAIDKCGFISSEFYSGAKWAINEFLKDLWHPSREEPRKGAVCLIQMKLVNSHGSLEYATAIYIGERKWTNIYISDDTDAKIIRWLYIDDLLLLNNNQNHA